MPFKVMDTDIPEVKFLEIQRFDDERGFFEEIYRNKIFHELGINNKFNQIFIIFQKKCFQGISFPVESRTTGQTCNCNIRKNNRLCN